MRYVTNNMKGIHLIEYDISFGHATTYIVRKWCNETKAPFSMASKERRSVNILCKLKIKIK